MHALFWEINEIMHQQSQTITGVLAVVLGSGKRQEQDVVPAWKEHKVHLGIWVRSSPGQQMRWDICHLLPRTAQPGGQPSKGSIFSPGPFSSLLPCSLLSFLSSSFHFILPSHLLAGFSELLRKLWIPSSSFSHAISVIACTRAEFAGSRSKIESQCFENGRHSEATLQPWQRAKLAPLSPAQPTPRRWAESSQPQLHRLKLLGGGGSSGDHMFSANPGVVLWFIGKLRLPEKRL